MPTHSHRGFLRGFVAAVVAVVTVAFGLLVAVPAHATIGPVSTERAGSASLLDGFEISVLPGGLGPHVSDFASEWEDVALHSRVWESEVDPADGGGYRVDLMVTVLRGERLTDVASLRRFLADYYELDPAGWRLQRFDHHGRPGYHDGRVAFWLTEPGVAVTVRIDDRRFTERDLLRTALGVHPV